MILQADNHASFVAICEQLALDLIDFQTNSVELEITCELPEGYDIERLGDISKEE